MHLRSWKAVAIGLAVLSTILLAVVVLLWSRDTSSSLHLLHPRSDAELGEWLEPHTLGTLQGIVGRPDSLPDGWLPCRGQILRKSDHPELFAAIGSAHPDAALPDDQFALPDLRGMYVLRLLPEALPWYLRLLPLDYGYSNVLLGKTWSELETLSDDRSPLRVVEVVWVVKGR